MGYCGVGHALPMLAPAAFLSYLDLEVFLHLLLVSAFPNTCLHL